MKLLPLKVCGMRYAAHYALVCGMRYAAHYALFGSYPRYDSHYITACHQIDWCQSRPGVQRNQTRAMAKERARCSLLAK